MKVDVLHPAPIRHVPNRTRTARTSYVPTVTPVTLRDFAWADTDPGPVLETSAKRRIVTRLVAGEPWRLIGADDTRRRVRGRSAPSPEDFRLWLEGAAGSEPFDKTDVCRAFAGTPVVARPIDRMVLLRGREPWDPGRIGLVLSDHSDRAGAGVRALFERDVALVDGLPMIRMRGPVAERGIHDWTVERFPGCFGGQISSGHGLYYRLDRALDQPTPEWGVELPRVGWDATEVAGLRYRGNEDLVLTVGNFVTAVAWSAAYAGAAHGWGVGPDWDALRERVHDLAAAASAFLLDEGGLSVALDLVGSAANRLTIPRANRRAAIERYQAYARDYARPILAAREAVSGADVEALAGLAP